MHSFLFQNLPFESHLEIAASLSAADLQALTQTCTFLRYIYLPESWKHCTIVPNDSKESPKHHLFDFETRKVPLSAFLSPYRYSWFQNFRVVNLVITEWCLDQLGKSLLSLKFLKLHYFNLKSIELKLLSRKTPYPENNLIEINSFKDSSSEIYFAHLMDLVYSLPPANIKLSSWGGFDGIINLKVITKLELCLRYRQIDTNFILPSFPNLEDFSFIPPTTIGFDIYHQVFLAINTFPKLRRVATAHFFTSENTFRLVKLLSESLEICKLIIFNETDNELPNRLFAEPIQLPAVTEFYFINNNKVPSNSEVIISSLLSSLHFSKLLSLELVFTPFGNFVSPFIHKASVENITSLQVYLHSPNESHKLLFFLKRFINVKYLSIWPCAVFSDILEDFADKDSSVEVVSEICRIFDISKRIFSSDIYAIIDDEQNNKDPEGIEQLEETVNSWLPPHVVSSLIEYPLGYVGKFMSEFDNGFLFNKNSFEGDLLGHCIVWWYCLFEAFYSQILYLPKVEYIHFPQIPNGLDSPRLSILLENHQSLKKVTFGEYFGRSVVSILTYPYYSRFRKVPFDQPSASLTQTQYPLDIYVYDTDTERKGYDMSFLKNKNLEYKYMIKYFNKSFRGYNYQYIRDTMDILREEFRSGSLIE